MRTAWSAAGSSRGSVGLRVRLYHHVAVHDLRRSLRTALLDVRSPGEFALGHIAGAMNVPVLGDGERKVVGTVWKQDGAPKARHLAAPLVLRNIAAALEASAPAPPQEWRPLIYCLRGGMR